MLYLEVRKQSYIQIVHVTHESLFPLPLSSLSPSPLSLSLSLFPCEEGGGYPEETRNFTNKHLCFMCVVLCVTLSVIGKIQTNYYIYILQVMSGQTEITHTEQAALVAWQNRLV
jgi:hypothetical protein